LIQGEFRETRRGRAAGIQSSLHLENGAVGEMMWRRGDEGGGSALALGEIRRGGRRDEKKKMGTVGLEVVTENKGAWGRPRGGGKWG